ncbi:MAG: hypothetical protein OXD36_02420 [Rhodobacter sp.]|nr:hypothetical protein [Rhodobacter sp.]
MTVPSAVWVAATPAEYATGALREAFTVLDATARKGADSGVEVWRDRLACEICRRGPETEGGEK